MPNSVHTPSERYRLLAGILSLRRFTSAQLSEATGVNPSTTKSWLQRSNGAGRYIFAAGKDIGKGGRGRRANLWEVQPEAVDAIRSDISRLTKLAEVRKGVTSDEEAASAFADTDFREAVRYNLREAERADTDRERQVAIAQAQKWFDFEIDRLIPWRDAGFDVPDPVRQEMANLDYRLTGLSRRVDELRSIAVRGVHELARYLGRSIDAWCESGGADQNAFAPLSFTGPASPTADLRKELADNLNIILQTAEQVATVRQEVVLFSLVMTIPRLQSDIAYSAICDVLDREGHDKVGTALYDVSRSLASDPDGTAILHQVLVGLGEFGSLLRNSIVGSWVDCLSTQTIYSDHLIAGLLYCLSRRPGVAFDRIAQERKAEIDRLVAVIEQCDSIWAKMNDDIRQDPLDRVHRNLMQRHQQVQTRAAAPARSGSGTAVFDEFLALLFPQAPVGA